MEYVLERQQIARVCADFAVTLQTTEGAELRLECPFGIETSGGSSTTDIDPGNLGVSSPLVVGLLNQVIEAASIAESGELVLSFSSGQTLQCRPNEAFEAWALTTPTGERFVCLPGGGLAHWPSGE